MIEFVLSVCGEETLLILPANPSYATAFPKIAVVVDYAGAPTYARVGREGDDIRLVDVAAAVALPARIFSVSERLLNGRGEDNPIEFC